MNIISGYMKVGLMKECWRNYRLLSKSIDCIACAVQVYTGRGKRLVCTLFLYEIGIVRII